MRKHFRYSIYLLRHKWFVFVAGRRLRVPLRRLLIHDWSKFLPAEWFAYVEKFYGDKRTAEETQKNFSRAWLHHVHYNAHHWQYWIVREDSGVTYPLELPETFAREMVADWCGAGRAIVGRWDASQWYAKNKFKMTLHPETRALVEALLVSYDYYSETKAFA